MRQLKEEDKSQIKARANEDIDESESKLFWFFLTKMMPTKAVEKNVATS